MDGQRLPQEEMVPHSSSPPPPPHEVGVGVSETVQGEFDHRRQEERERWQHLPSKYKGYEALLSAVPDSSVVVPKGGSITHIRKL